MIFLICDFSHKNFKKIINDSRIIGHFWQLLDAGFQFHGFHFSLWTAWQTPSQFGKFTLMTNQIKNQTMWNYITKRKLSNWFRTLSPNISSSIKIDRTFMKQQQQSFYIIAWSPFLLWDLLVGAPRTSFCSSSKKLTIWEWYFFETDTCTSVPK